MTRTLLIKPANQVSIKFLLPQQSSSMNKLKNGFLAKHQFVVEGMENDPEQYAEIMMQKLEYVKKQYKAKKDVSKKQNC